jgi:hypothetical protein
MVTDALNVALHITVEVIHLKGHSGSGLVNIPYILFWASLALH